MRAVQVHRSGGRRGPPPSGARLRSLIAQRAVLDDLEEPAVRAVQITEFGGPEVLKVTELPDPEPAEGFALLEVSSAGVNYADTHQVEDSYPSKTSLPLVPGSEVVGRLPDGTRVAAFAMFGGYAEKALVHPAMSFPLPEAVTDGQGLSLMVQGLTA